MFNTLGKKITLALSITLSVFVVFTSFTLYNVIKRNIYESYINTSVQYTQQKYKSLQIYMGLVEETSRLLSNESKITAFNGQVSRIDIETILDGLKSTYNDFSTVGIYWYGSNGKNFSSSNISDMPAYNDIVMGLGLDKFLDSGENSVWVIRSRNIHEEIKINISDNYNTSYGLLTFISKIYDSSGYAYKGILVINVDIMKLYNLFNSQNDKFFGQASLYILDGERILPYPAMSKALKHDLEMKILSDKGADYPILHNNNIILYNPLSQYSDTFLASVMPLSPFFNTLNIFVAILGIVSFLFIIYFLIISKLLSKSITIPLGKLYEKMGKSL